jgi:hypothetical protein
MLLAADKVTKYREIKKTFLQIYAYCPWET